MVFLSKGWRRALAAAAVSATLLSACGGGDTVVEFRPGSMVAFGDEQSRIETNGHKYTVNGLTAATPAAFDCTGNPIWIQVVAANYGMSFAECPQAGLPANATQRTAVGLTVAQLVPMVDDFLANGSPNEQMLATVMVGTHDVLALYNESPRRSEAALMAEMQARGTQLAQQVNRIALAGPAVVLSTIPNLGQTPLARAAGGDAGLLTRMTAAFNAALRTDIIQDGRFIGIVFADQAIDNFVRFQAAYGYTNVTEGVCTVALPDCTTATVASGNTPSTWLWADSFRPGPSFQLHLGNIAISRARNNPF
jgi:outer membrane lipase/esterase